MLRTPFIVTHEPPVAQQPTETTFDHPPARNGFATLLYAAVWRLRTRLLAAGTMELQALS
jgi:hypothetical protein